MSPLRKADEDEKEVSELEKQMGRMIRNMSFPGMNQFLTNRSWSPPIDIYETEVAILIYIETAGIDLGKLSVVADETAVTIAGLRQRPIKEKVSRVHQLEIEHGYFHRAIRLPVQVNVNETVSSYKDGFLEIRLPKRRPRGKIEIKISQ